MAKRPAGTIGKLAGQFVMHIQFWGGPLNGWLRQAAVVPLKAIIFEDLNMPDGRQITYAFRYIKVFADDSCAVLYLHDVQIADPAGKPQ